MERKKIKSECDYIGFRNNKLKYKCKKCRKRSTKLISKAVRNFPITYKFCKGDHNKFALLLRKDVYPYEYMDDWEKINETSIPSKEAYYSKLNEEDISDANYVHTQKVWDVFEIKNQGENHDLYLLSDALLLSDVFENFRDKCIEIHGLDPAHLLSA